MAKTENRGRISTFKSYSNLDYARPNLFQVDLYFPTAVTDVIAKSASTDIKNKPATEGENAVNAIRTLAGFTVKGAQIPSSTVGVIEVPFRGRMLKIAGDRTFEPWTITIHNDTGFRLRSWFESWMEAIQLYDENATAINYGIAPAGTTDYLNYMTDMKVTQLDRRGNAVRSYKFYSVWPSNISAIDLDFGTNDAIEEFTVELQVQYWTPVEASTDTELETKTQA